MRRFAEIGAINSRIRCCSWKRLGAASRGLPMPCPVKKVMKSLDGPSYKFTFDKALYSANKESRRPKSLAPVPCQTNFSFECYQGRVGLIGEIVASSLCNINSLATKEESSQKSVPPPKFSDRIDLIVSRVQLGASKDKKSHAEQPMTSDRRTHREDLLRNFAVANCKLRTSILLRAWFRWFLSKEW